MAEAATTTPEELRAQERQNQQEQERARVSPLDPDFLLFALPFAILVDSLDIILELFGLLIIPKVLGLTLDVFTFFILGTWLYLRTGKLIKSKQKQQAGGGVGKAAIRGPLKKVFTRLGLTFIIEAVPFLGIFFAWTLMVILTLRDK